MLKGHVFREQIFASEVFAFFVNTFLDGKCGIGDFGNKMAVTYSGNNITIQDGLVCIKGRFVEEDSSKTINVGTEAAFCRLVIEIDLSKENTEETLNQVAYKIIKATNDYPVLTQTDIVKNNKGIYQYELVSFKITSNGIIDFEDKRTYLDFNSIYKTIKEEHRELLKKIQQELANIENESAYMLNKVDVANIKLKSNGSVELYVQFKRTGNVVFVKTRVYIPANVTGDANLINITNIMPEFAKTKERVATGDCFVVTVCEADNLKMSITKEDNENYFFTMSFSVNPQQQSSYIEAHSTYIVDDEIVTENDYTLGDVDGDGIITSSDADLVRQYNMGEITFTSKQFKAADMNKDGEIGPSDYVILCNKIAEMYQKGDVNTDGVVDTEDLQLVKDYLVGNIEFNSAQKQLADMNGDGEVTETDMAKLSMLVK